MSDNRIYELREDNDMYQKDVASLLGVKQQTYSLWENGDNIVPLKHLNTLSNFYGVTMDYIFKLTDENNFNNIKQTKSLNKKDIGTRLQKIRKEHNLTLRELAKKLNTTSSTISQYETGKTLILTAFAYQICKEYDISLDWLCGRID